MNENEKSEGTDPQSHRKPKQRARKRNAPRKEIRKKTSTGRKRRHNTNYAEDDENTDLWSFFSVSQEKETYNPKKAAVEYSNTKWLIFYHCLIIINVIIWKTQFKEIEFLRSLNTGLLVAFCVMEWRSKFSKKGTKKNNDDYSWLLWLLNALVDFAEIKEIPTDEEGRVVLFLARLFVYIMAYFGVQVATFEKQLNWSESGGGVIGATIGLVLWETFCKLFEMTFTQLPSISNSTMTLQ